MGPSAWTAVAAICKGQVMGKKVGSYLCCVVRYVLGGDGLMAKRRSAVK